MEHNTSEPPKRDYLLPASILIAGIMVSGSIFYLVGSREVSQNQQVRGNEQNQPAGLNPMEIGTRDVVLGNPDAPITIVEYGDYQCPFCARFDSQTKPQIREQYIKPGIVRMVYRNFAFLGPESFAAGEAAECAKDQRQFWAFHDALYAAEEKDAKEFNGNLNRDLFIQLASNAKLDTKAFGECLDSGKYKLAVTQESENARLSGVESTPTFFINGKKIAGACPFNAFQQAIDAERNGKQWSVDQRCIVTVN